MAITWRRGLLFGGAILLGFALGTGALMALQGTSPEQAANDSAAPQSAAGTTVASCGFEPLLQPAAERDAQFSAPAEVIDKTTSDIAAYVSVAADAATQGRVHDAEVAFITACRIAGHLAGARSLELADTQYQLARHYTTVAAAGPAGDSQRGEVLRRAQTLFDESMQGYTARFGAPHEKTRLAAAGLTLARQAASLAEQFQMAAAAAPGSAASASLLAVATPASAAASSVGGASAATATAKVDTSVMGAAPAPPKKKPRPKPQPEVEYRAADAPERDTTEVDAAPSRPAAASGDARSGTEPGAP